MFCNWLNYVDPVSVFIYDSFGRNPSLQAQLSLVKATWKMFLLKDMLFVKKDAYRKDL
jgi:hypothetical protein